MNTNKNASALIAILIFFCTSHALAGLGAKEDSVELDSRMLSGVHSKISNSNYTVHEIQAKGGVIREYVSLSGVVFGVAWLSPSHPDLSQLLGSYNEEFQNISKPNMRQKGHQPKTFNSSRLHVELSGHMGALKRGRAFDPSLIPQGVSTEVIQ